MDKFVDPTFEAKQLATQVRTDGGRKAAGYRGSAGDCVTRAIAIVTSKPYQEVYDALSVLVRSHRQRTGKRLKSSSARNGVPKAVYHKYLLSLGFTWTPTMRIGSGCQVHLRREELPNGRLVVRLSGHMVAVIDGVIHDTDDPSRGGRRCVYGYFSKG
jgi:hypothetical protein